MELRFVRLGAAILILAVLAVFFVPLVSYSIPYSCVVPPGGFRYGCGPMPPSGFFTGFNSLGLQFVHWGASSGGFLGGGTYNPPVITLIGSELTALGALVLVVIPAILCAAALLSPEERRGIHFVRVRLHLQ
jgi:hypothetical protein